MSREKEVQQIIESVLDPKSGKSLGTLHFVRSIAVDDQNVTVQIQIPDHDEAQVESIKAACEDALSGASWIRGIRIQHIPAPAPRRSGLSPQGSGLSKVKTILAVSSCKGGVGKSTAAVSMAYTLAKTGAQVGLFDADVYGPSLPTMIHPSETDVYTSGDLIEPLQHDGVKLMSFGYVQREAEQAAIMRGPMVTQVINQLLTGTDWGTLDYLVLDLPPGTGDVQLTLTQVVPIDAAIIVTTPQQLSFVDVVKGIQMFTKLKVPAIAVIQNMSYFLCPDNNQKYYLFGKGARERLVEQFGIKNSYEIPIDPRLSEYGDKGTPFVLADVKQDISSIYEHICKDAVKELDRLKSLGDKRPQLSFKPGDGISLNLPSGETYLVTPAILRRRCRCAACIEEMTGRPLLDPSSVPDSIYPTSFEPMGNYAVAVTWSDGHASSIYPFESIIEAATSTESAEA